MKANFQPMTDVPRDRAIVLWHRVWQCPIACKWNGHGFVELTYSHTWKESDFSAWDEMPERPLQDSIPEPRITVNQIVIEDAMGTLFYNGKESDEKEVG